SKKQKLNELSSPSPPQLGFDNALLPLATYDDEDEEDEERDGKQNGHNNYEEEEEEDEEEENNNGFGVGRRNRTIEIRRDCPYLDTVNRQVFTSSLPHFPSHS
ncbi:hypothetical protein PVM78_22755, partial [Bacillus licheniformis]|nr:hypothetical protein [Bacillus licheniformis]